MILGVIFLIILVLILWSEMNDDGYQKANPIKESEDALHDLMELIKNNEGGKH